LFSNFFKTSAVCLCSRPLWQAGHRDGC